MAVRTGGSSRWGDLTELAALREDLLSQLPTWITDNLENYKYITMGVRIKGNHMIGYGRRAPTEIDLTVDLFSLNEMRDRALELARLHNTPPGWLVVRLKY